MRKTKSEMICSEIGEKFFSKDFVYENLQYFNEKNNKVELCDGLFEFGEFYFALQIKERSSEKGGKKEASWMEDIVYGEAVEQIKQTINALQKGSIIVSDLRHSKVELNKNYTIIPIIVFSNKEIVEYKRCVSIEGLTIHIFSLEDYKSMMNIIIHPYDIVEYLSIRREWISKEGKFSSLAIGDNENTVILSTIDNEQDFISFFCDFSYYKDVETRRNSLRLLSIISKYKEHEFVKYKDFNRNYKKILKLLQLIRPELATAFIERFDYGWKNSFDNIFDFSKCIQLQHNGIKTDIVFFSLGTTGFSNKKYYDILRDAKQLQHNSDNILIICFVGCQNSNCQIDWVYYEGKHEHNDAILKMYENLGMFDGNVSRELYEKMCEKWIDHKN